MVRVDTPLGAVNFPMLDGVVARGSAIIDPDGTVKAHIVVEPQDYYPRRHLVYLISRRPPRYEGVREPLTIKLLRDDGELPW